MTAGTACVSTAAGKPTTNWLTWQCRATCNAIDNLLVTKEICYYATPVFPPNVLGSYCSRSHTTRTQPSKTFIQAIIKRSSVASFKFHYKTTLVSQY